MHAKVILLIGILVHLFSASHIKGQDNKYFMRYSPPSPPQVAKAIKAQYKELGKATEQGDTLRIFDISVGLGENLTIAGREKEAISLLLPLLRKYEGINYSEDMAWLMLNLATALQYSDQREEARQLFEQSLQLCQQMNYQGVVHFVHHHYGRLLVETGNLTAAGVQFRQALQIRQLLKDKRQASTEKALDSLGILTGKGSHVKHR